MEQPASAALPTEKGIRFFLWLDASELSGIVSAYDNRLRVGRFVIQGLSSLDEIWMILWMM